LNYILQSVEPKINYEQKKFLRDTKIFPASNFCEKFPGSGAAAALFQP
jgi:hypothetical protein